MPMPAANNKPNRRIYVVKRLDNDVETLVRAPLPASAIGHIARSEYEVHIASQDDLVRLIKTHPVEEFDVAA